jgi:cation diffusion facilitator family transporter
MSRGETIRRVGAAVLLVNVALVALKGAAWLATGSLAVGSEAVNSLTDVGYSVVILAGLHLTAQPPDVDHPHGHERIEPFVSLFIALAIFGAGALVLWQATTAVLTGDVGVATGQIGAAVLAVTIVAKWGLYRYCLSAGQRVNSPALVATAKDNRVDVLTATAALVGVVGAAAGFPVLDPLAAGVVSLGILYTGVEIVQENVDYLVGRAPPEDLRREILRRALAHPEVEGVHDVVAHYVGPEIDVSLHVEVEGDRTLFEAHDIETDVVEAIRGIEEVDDVFVHVDPRELGEWKDEERADRLAG